MLCYENYYLAENYFIFRSKPIQKQHPQERQRQRKTIVNKGELFNETFESFNWLFN